MRGPLLGAMRLVEAVARDDRAGVDAVLAGPDVAALARATATVAEYCAIAGATVAGGLTPDSSQEEIHAVRDGALRRVRTWIELLGPLA